jgi:hypothetical protein
MLTTTMLAALVERSSAAKVMGSFVSPVVRSLCVLASTVCVFFIINGGLQYMSSAGRPDKLEHAKHILKNALLGLVIVLAAATLTTILTHTYASSTVAMSQRVPSLTTLKPTPISNGLVDILIKAITGLLNSIIQSVAAPFLKALTYFTSSTPLMADNSSVFNLWLVIVGITDVLFVIAIALLGFNVMGASTFGFDEVDFKHLLPRIGLMFLLVNSSIFAIDGVIELSNAMIRALNAGQATSSVWSVLTDVVKQSSGLGVAALLIMITFLVYSVILLVYYVGRLVTLYLGAVLSPIILLLWLIPGFRDFSESAAKTYMTTVFVLFVHVVILELAASLFAGLIVGSPTHAPDTLMALILGLATVITLLKTQGVMMQFSYANLGPRSARRLGGQFINGISYFSERSNALVTTINPYANRSIATATYSSRQPLPKAIKYTQPNSSIKNKPRKATSESGKSIKTNAKTISPRASKLNKSEDKL